jgi:pyrimidine nucleoside transport protein
LARFVVRCQNAGHSFWQRFGDLIKTASLVILVVAYFAYFAYAMYYRFGDEGSIRLLWVTCLVVVCMALKLAFDCCQQHSVVFLPQDSLQSAFHQHRRLINW